MRVDSPLKGVVQSRYHIIRKQHDPLTSRPALLLKDSLSERICLGLLNCSHVQEIQLGDAFCPSLGECQLGETSVLVYQFHQQPLSQALKRKKKLTPIFQAKLLQTLLQAYSVLQDKEYPIPPIAADLITYNRYFDKQELEEFKYFYSRPLLESCPELHSTDYKQARTQLALFLLDIFVPGKPLHQKNGVLRGDLLKEKMNSLAGNTKEAISNLLQNQITTKCVLMTFTKLPPPLLSSRCNLDRSIIKSTRKLLQGPQLNLDKLNKQFQQFQKRLKQKSKAKTSASKKANIEDDALIKFKNGDTFVGKIQKGLMKAGTYFFSDRTRCHEEAFQGEMCPPFPQQGFYRYSSGDVYRGGFKNGRKEGNGVMRYKCGDFLVGWWEDGRIVSGNALYKSGDKFMGTWNYMQDSFLSEGQMEYANGDFFKGFFKDGIRMRGLYLGKSGLSYFGDFNQQGLPKVS